MKKNFEYLSINSAFLERLIKLLEKYCKDLKDASDVISSFKSLLNGSSSSIMIELGDEISVTPTQNILKREDLTIYINSRRVTRNGEDIALTPKEFELLYFLAKNKGEVFTKEQIYKAVWDDDYLLDDSNVMAFIRKLRKKIEPNPDSPKYILTMWGIGYMFNDRL